MTGNQSKPHPQGIPPLLFENLHNLQKHHPNGACKCRANWYKINTMTKQRQWFDRVAEGHSLRSIAEAIGTSHGNLSNWLKADKLSAERVIAISYELGIDPVKALAETGHLREVHADEEVSKEELLERIQKLTERLRREIEEESNVIDLNSRRKSAQSVSMFENMVADSSPDEDALRDRDGEHD